ncbi:T9SS type A sorting domain-containing protein [bacterium]|nr:T9SS type A sorting domain-containing protein [bacterium]
MIAELPIREIAFEPGYYEQDIALNLQGVPAGTYYAYVQLDVYDEVPEADEEYNMIPCEDLEHNIAVIVSSPAVAAPDVPVPVSPADGALGLSLNPEFRWNAGEGGPPDQYELEVKNGAGTVLHRAWQVSNSREIGPLEYQTTYTWRVRAGNGAGESGWSASRTFTTQPRPPDMAAVTFRVTVPACTPPGDIVYLAGGFNAWDPGPGSTGSGGVERNLPMTDLGENRWEITLPLQSGSAVEYKYTRGSWDLVEIRDTEDPNLNRSLAVPSGAHTQEDAVFEWRDVRMSEGWTQQADGGSGRLFAADAVTGQTGWIAGEGGAVFYTSDGGDHWVPVQEDFSDYMIYAIAGLDAGRAMLAASHIFQTRIFRTENRGSSWQMVLDQTGCINALTMHDGSNGLAIGDPVDGVWTVLRTTDGGMTWPPVAEPPASVQNEYGYPAGACWVDADEVWFGSTQNRLYHSTSGGSSWEVRTVPHLSKITSVCFNPLGIGLLSDYSQLVRTEDRGTTWAQAAPPVSGLIRAIRWLDESFWILIDNHMYRSDFHGNRWEWVLTAPEALRCLSLFRGSNAMSGWAAGNSGMILRYFGPGSGGSAVEALSGAAAPGRAALHPAYPNPFNGVTRISFDLPWSGRVSLAVYDLRGRKVEVLIDGQRPAGRNTAAWNAGDRPSGMYFIRLLTAESIDTRKILLLK